MLQAAPLAAFTQLVGYRLTDSHTSIATAPYLLETPATFVRLVRSVAAHAAAQCAAAEALPVLAVPPGARRQRPVAVVGRGRVSLLSVFGHSSLSANRATGPPRGGNHSPLV